MVIRLSPTLKRRVEREAKSQGITPSKFIEDTLKDRLRARRKPRGQVSEARRQLRELLRHNKVEDFDTAVHAAKRYAGKLLEDNAEWIDRVSAQGTEHGRG